MGQNMPDEDFLPPILDLDYQAVFVPTDVEDGKPFDIIRCREHSLDLHEILEQCLAYELIPSIQRHLCRWKAPGEIVELLPRYDMHNLNISHFEIFSEIIFLPKSEKRKQRFGIRQ